MFIFLEESKVSVSSVCQRIRKGLAFMLLEVIRILYSSKHKLPSCCAWLVISSEMPAVLVLPAVGRHGLSLSFYEELFLAIILYFHSSHQTFQKMGFFKATHGPKWFRLCWLCKCQAPLHRCLQRCTCITAPVDILHVLGAK